jgi:hypothetical protein
MTARFPGDLSGPSTALPLFWEHTVTFWLYGVIAVGA